MGRIAEDIFYAARDFVNSYFTSRVKCNIPTFEILSPYLKLRTIWILDHILTGVTQRAMFINGKVYYNPSKFPDKKIEKALKHIHQNKATDKEYYLIGQLILTIAHESMHAIQRYMHSSSEKVVLTQKEYILWIEATAVLIVLEMADILYRSVYNRRMDCHKDHGSAKEYFFCVTQQDHLREALKIAFAKNTAYLIFSLTTKKRKPNIESLHLPFSINQDFYEKTLHELKTLIPKSDIDLKINRKVQEFMWKYAYGIQGLGILIRQGEASWPEVINTPLTNEKILKALS